MVVLVYTLKDCKHDLSTESTKVVFDIFKPVLNALISRLKLWTKVTHSRAV